jgi:hypothetical protein
MNLLKASIQFFLCQILITNEYQRTTLFEDAPAIDPTLKKIYRQLFSLYLDKNQAILQKEDNPAFI